jgi:hypothetical protein
VRRKHVVRCSTPSQHRHSPATLLTPLRHNQSTHCHSQHFHLLLALT